MSNIELQSLEEINLYQGVNRNFINSSQTGAQLKLELQHMENKM